MRHTFFMLMLPLVVAGCFNPPDDVTYELNSPVKVATDESFDIMVTLKNDDSKPHELNSIDIGDPYLEGIAITGASPRFQSSSHLPIDNTYSHEFKVEIPAQGSLEVVLNAMAVAEGDYRGDFDICIDGPTDCLFDSIRTVVAE